MIAFIDDHRAAYGVEPICRVLPIAPSTYHAHAARRADPTRVSTRARRDDALIAEVRRVFEENFGVYGVRKVWRQLKREGHDVARCTVARGFVYLTVVLDWFSRRVLAWRVSIDLAVEFCLEAVEEAIARHGKPDIFNTDQGSQFASAAFTGLLADNGIAISMDGKGAWRDNVFVERLWRSVK